MRRSRTVREPASASLAPLRGSQACVAAVLSDGVIVHGRLTGADVGCSTLAGVSVRVPLLLIADYVQPQPLATEAEVDRVKHLVAHLSVDDWRDRDRAQEQLISMGPVIADLLRKLRPDQTPEGQQCIDTILGSPESQLKP